jgi:hypothetical protein
MWGSRPLRTPHSAVTVYLSPSLAHVLVPEIAGLPIDVFFLGVVLFIERKDSSRMSPVEAIVACCRNSLGFPAHAGVHVLLST